MESGSEQKTIVNKEKITTIKISNTTKKRIDNIRIYPRETYDNIMTRILEILNLTRLDPERSRARLISIDKERKRNLNVLKNQSKENN